MPDPKPELPSIGGLYLSTATESANRAAILPSVGSEDMSSLLGTLPIRWQKEVDSGDYLPNSALEWIVHATFGIPLKANAVASIFGKDWRAKYGGLTIYGRDASTGHWTFLVSADGPEEVSGLQFAWAYYASWSQDAELAPAAMYEARLQAVERELSQLTATAVYSEVSAQVAYKRAKHLSTLSERLNRSVSVRLAAPAGKQFSGGDVWDVMLSLGLKWGDMDCFHWQNPSGYGDDFFFSVWTSTQPGYFLPEEVAANRVSIADLVFGYSIPRSADPVTIYSRMLRAIEYAQKRLGGTIASEDGRLLNEEATVKGIKSISDELEKFGFRPGSDIALRQF